MYSKREVRICIASDNQRADLAAGVAVKEVRLWRGHSIRELSRKTGICTNVICKFEKGERGLKLKDLIKVCMALDLELTIRPM